MNRKVIKKKPKNGCKSYTRHFALASFIDDKVCDMLKVDADKVSYGKSEFNGKLNRYVNELIKEDLKFRNLL